MISLQSDDESKKDNQSPRPHSIVRDLPPAGRESGQRKLQSQSKLSPSPTFNVDSQVISPPFCWKKTPYFPTLIMGGLGIRDTDQVSQLLLARIGAREDIKGQKKMIKKKKWHKR